MLLLRISVQVQSYLSKSFTPCCFFIPYWMVCQPYTFTFIHIAWQSHNTTDSCYQPSWHPHRKQRKWDDLPACVLPVISAHFVSGALVPDLLYKTWGSWILAIHNINLTSGMTGFTQDVWLLSTIVQKLLWGTGLISMLSH